MTRDINEWWGVTVHHAEKIGPKRWRATAYAFRRDTQKRVGETYEGIGTTMNTADDIAERLAERFALAQGKPADWKKQ